MRLSQLTIFLLLIALSLASVSARADHSVVISPSTTYGKWEGWGASLCWWANQLGDRDDLADIAFTLKSVTWEGKSYLFAKGQQANAVAELWKAWEDGTPTLSEKTIAELIGAEDVHFKLSKVFRKRVRVKKLMKYAPHPAWKTVITTAGKGVFRLGNNGIPE